MYIDSHCHLDRLRLGVESGTLSDALNNARAREVSGFLCIGIGFDNTEELLQIERANEDVWLSMGVHPLEENLSVELAQLRHWCGLPQVVAVGETGLDYHYSADTKEAQKISFERHLQVASELEKPLIVHTREARQDTLDLIREYSGPAAGVLHCFTESWEMAREAIDMGYYISISGIVTFRNAEALRDVVRKLPLDRLLIETDSPYLAPVPHRGKSNEPSLLPHVAECIAELKGISAAELAERTTENFFRLFRACRPK